MELDFASNLPLAGLSCGLVVLAAPGFAILAAALAFALALALVFDISGSPFRGISTGACCTWFRAPKEPLWRKPPKRDTLEPMTMLLRQIARYVAQKAAADPRAREIALKAAQSAADEAKHIARQDDRAYAAGRAVRQALNRLNNGR